MSLAIVIPAFKDKFLYKTLLSFEEQTIKNFTIYIGDDHSPYDLKSISDKFKNTLDIKYTRFDNNIGAKNLVHQWNRCVNLIKDEKWIWLFSDDDIAESNCVETFYNVITNDNNKFDVYRFNTTIINDNDEVLTETPLSPFIDTSENMAYEVLMGMRGHSMPDHIFSREIYLKSSGFVFTDYAQSADWATFILFSKDKGICTMQEAKVRWRLGSSNISGQTLKNHHEMIKGFITFLEWALDHFKYLKINGYEYLKLKKAIKFNLKSVLMFHYKGIELSDFKIVFPFCKKYTSNYFQAVNMIGDIYYTVKFKPYLSNKKKLVLKYFN